MNRRSKFVKLSPQSFGVFPNQVTHLAFNNLNLKSDDESATLVKNNWYFIHVTKYKPANPSGLYSNLLFSMDYPGFIYKNHSILATKIFFRLKLDLNTPTWIDHEMHLVKFIRPEHETLRRIIRECNYTVDGIGGIPTSAIDISTSFSQRACSNGFPYQINTYYEFFEFKMKANKTTLENLDEFATG